MLEDGEQFIGYLKFFGPSVDEGKIDIEKIGNSLVALNKLYKKYAKQQKSENVILKLGKIKKKCTEVNIYLEQIATIAQPVAQTASWLIVAKSIGITEFGKQFFGTIGNQLALKIFSKGKKIEKEKEFIKDGEVLVLAKNIDGEEMSFPKEIYDSQNDFAGPLRDLVQLEEKKEERMEVGYYQDCKVKKVADIEFEQKEFITAFKEIALEDRLEEEFDDSRATKIRIVGKFVDYYGLAHKYHFSFQARKNQEEMGKQKILCKIEDINVSTIIDLLKPENQEKNVCVFGMATVNSEGKIDKIKIEWINNDENFNPNQKKLIW